MFEKRKSFICRFGCEKKQIIAMERSKEFWLWVSCLIMLMTGSHCDHWQSPTAITRNESDILRTVLSLLQQHVQDQDVKMKSLEEELSAIKKMLSQCDDRIFSLKTTVPMKTPTSTIPTTDGEFSDWSEWSICSSSCNVGSKNRTRTCSNPSPRNGGKPCNGLSIEYGICNTHQCPIDGGFSEWGIWTPCTVTCGRGLSTRKRFCANPRPHYGGKNCSGLYSESQLCIENQCPIDGGFSEWNSWSKCSTSCGGGLKVRKRTCSNPSPHYGGLNCTGQYEDTEYCNTLPCPVNGGFGSWDSWSACSSSCEGGTKRRSRPCNSPLPALDGKNCSGDFTQSLQCNEFPCPINGGFTEWTIWSQCSQSCGGGMKTRSRTCTNPLSQHGGKPCSGHFFDYLNCNVYHCPVNGGFSLWGVWSECSVTCGGGTSLRRRFCSNPAPQFGGKLCLGSSNETRVCNIESCSICENPSIQFECHDKRYCIDNSFACDGYPDCDDESDESQQACSTEDGLPRCPDGLFKCPDTTCVEVTHYTARSLIWE